MEWYDPNTDQHENADGLRILAKLTQLPIERIEYYADSDTSLVVDIQCGILFIMAFWSGPSVNAFRKLTEIVKRLDPNAELRFVVVDIDGAQSFCHHPQFAGKMGGWGETAWVSDGKIQNTSGLGFNPGCFEPHTKALLARCRQRVL